MLVIYTCSSRPLNGGACLIRRLYRTIYIMKFYNHTHIQKHPHAYTYSVLCLKVIFINNNMFKWKKIFIMHFFLSKWRIFRDYLVYKIYWHVSTFFWDLGFYTRGMWWLFLEIKWQRASSRFQNFAQYLDEQNHFSCVYIY